MNTRARATVGAFVGGTKPPRFGVMSLAIFAGYMVIKLSLVFALMRTSFWWLAKMFVKSAPGRR